MGNRGSCGKLCGAVWWGGGGEARISALDVLDSSALVVGGGTLEVAGGLVFGHGANALWMGSPDQIKDKRVLAATDGTSLINTVIVRWTRPQTLRSGKRIW